MKRLLWLSVIVVFALQVRSAQLSCIVLNVDHWGEGTLPSGWQVKVNRGKPDFSISREGGMVALHLKSRNSSFALERSVDVDPAEMPWLSWKWKVVTLPAGGDFRRSRTDDQAAQVLVAFSDRRILSYIWDSSAPQGIMQSASAIPLVRIFAKVCRSGAAELNQWLPENHNIVHDYQSAYGRNVPRVKGLRLQINSQHTGTSAESYFGEVAFRNMPQ